MTHPAGKKKKNITVRIWLDLFCFVVPNYEFMMNAVCSIEVRDPLVIQVFGSADAW